MGKRLCWIFAFTAAWLIWRCLRPALARRGPSHATVYINQNGGKYHRRDCRFVTRAMRPLALDQAVRLYQPCAVCKPDQGTLR